MKPCTRLLLPTLLAFASPGVLLAQSSSDPSVGTWVLNVGKSSFKPVPGPQSETRTYEVTPDGMIRVTVHQVAANGTANTETSTYKRDGKPYAFTGSALIDAIRVRRVNAHELRSDEMRNGEVIGHETIVLSADGKTMTFRGTLQTASGQTEHRTRVYDRQ